MITTAQATNILSLLTIVGQILAVAIVFALLIKARKVLKFIAKHALLGVFAVSLSALLGSLFYSDIAGYEPCKLCWYQRVLMYPQALLYGLAILKKDKKIADYGILLSIVGAVIAGYHYLLQIGFLPSVSCGVVGYSVSCSQRFVLQYGYITIPMMALSAFLLIAALLTVLKFSNKKKA